MAWRNVYDTGLISIAANATVAIGSGTAWASLKDQANLLFAGNGVALVVDVTDNTHLAIPAWRYDAVVAGDYELVQFPVSSLQASKQILDFLASVVTQGIPYVVPDGGTPDDGTRDDGTIAIRFSPVPIVFWKRVAGHYEFQGNFVGIGQTGAYDPLHSYNANDIATLFGTAYSSKHGDNLGNTPTGAADDPHWSVFVKGGGRIEMTPGSLRGRLAPSERLIEYVATAPFTIPLNMAESIIRAGAPATSDAVFSVRRVAPGASGDGIEIGTATIAAGDTVPTCDVPEFVVTADGTFVLLAPATSDATLADLRINVVAYR